MQIHLSMSSSVVSLALWRPHTCRSNSKEYGYNRSLSLLKKRYFYTFPVVRRPVKIRHWHWGNWEGYRQSRLSQHYKARTVHFFFLFFLCVCVDAWQFDQTFCEIWSQPQLVPVSNYISVVSDWALASYIEHGESYRLAFNNILPYTDRQNQIIADRKYKEYVYGRC